MFYVAEVRAGKPLESFDGKALFESREEALQQFNWFVELLPEREFGVYELVKIAGEANSSDDRAR